MAVSDKTRVPEPTHLDDVPAWGPEVPADARRDLIEERWPSTAVLVFGPVTPESDAAWLEVLEHDEVLHRLLKDLIKREVKGADVRGAQRALMRFSGEDYSMEPFVRALRAMVAPRSIRHAARNAGVSKSHLARLLSGEAQPSIEDLRTIAAGFGRDPSYFREYRAWKLAEHVTTRMCDLPDISVALYRQLVMSP